MTAAPLARSTRLRFATKQFAGIWAENSTATNESVTIENSSFHDIDNSAVVTLTANPPMPPTLSATVRGNSSQAAYYTVQLLGAGGSFTGNVINGGFEAIITGPSTVSANTVTNASYAGMNISGYYGGATVSGNTVSNSPQGIVACCGVTATSTKISNASSIGIYDRGGDNTYQSNAIAKAGVGIEFDCQSPTVVSNLINEATTGLDNVPASFSSANSFNNVVTLRTDGCGSRPVHEPDLPAPPSGPMRAPAH